MKYSIAIPAYKGKYLKQAIDSVLAQKYNDFELIIVNDASPEDLDSIVSSYIDPRIHYFKNEKNCGALRVVDNWNICLSKVQGEFIICMGDDDRLLPDCLEVYNRLMEKYPGLDVYHGWTEIINEYSQVTDIQEPRPEFEGVFSAIWGRFHGRKQFIGDYLFRTSTLKAEGGFYYSPMAWGSDDITAFRAMLSKGVANTQQPVFQYRRSNITLSSSHNYNYKMQGLLKIFDWERLEIWSDTIALNQIEDIYRKILRRDFDFLIKKRQKEDTFMYLISGKKIKKLFNLYYNKDKYRLDSKTIFKIFIKTMIFKK